MGYDKLIPMMLIPALLLGQNSQLSDAARELLSKPRVGSAQLTWLGGRKEDGRIVRVTDQFVTFERNGKPSTCENVELSKVAAVQWSRAPKSSSSSDLAGIVLAGAVLSPFFAANAVADPFRRLFPPRHPLRGEWETIRRSHGGFRTTLTFKGSTIQSWEMTFKQGHYRVEEDRLYLMFDGGIETVTPFRFDCSKLILDSPAATFTSRQDTAHPASAPIVGVWYSSGSVLDLKPDGTFEGRKEKLREGTFEMTATGARIHWADSQSPSGEEWTVQFRHSHLLVRVGGVTMEYRYLPPGFLDEL